MTLAAGRIKISSAAVDNLNQVRCNEVGRRQTAGGRAGRWVGGAIKRLAVGQMCQDSTDHVLS